MWNSKDFDPQVLSGALLAAMKQTLQKAENIIPSQEPKAETTQIVEYESRMRALGVEKLDTTSYVSVVNFYLSQSDLDRHTKTKGAVVLYLETESAAKFFKALEIPFAEDEDDASMVAACGQFVQKIADNLKVELTRLGYTSLYAATPRNYKNSVVEGVSYSGEQKNKHELSFFYFRRKAIVLELTLAPIPKK